MPAPSASTTQLHAGITAIDTDYVRPLQDASHLIVAGARAAIVDTGANNAVPLILDALRQRGLTADAVDYLFLTHVHLDHAGGAGQLMRALPNATCIVHPRGARHMIDPTRLIAGTEAVYGVERTRQIYGDIVPIDADRVIEADDGQWFELNGRRLQSIHTEGHAKHHYVLNDPASRGVFTGDNFGVSYRETDTVNGAIGFPTTTPVDFDPDAAHESIEKILACDPEYAYLTHYSRIGDLEPYAARLHAALDDYVRIAEDCAALPERTKVIEQRLFDYMCERLEQHGVEADRDTMWSIMSIDATLNAQGLSVWLDRRAKRQQASEKNL